MYQGCTVVAVKSKRLTPVKNFETNLRLSYSFQKDEMIKQSLKLELLDQYFE
jgi:hypothetical protein